ncbi:hypothetical protein AMS68_002433 [Peltaster fructicola]|uniref:Methyltransferase type 11 domain-containing protein n=1 Tax=Peltaster fructicola TaxID=286661 RepID=A0A6H0XQF0_9PEZI|nr:hypothetical protein AMS68_002433 [Peltaster fructicola]
MAALQLPATTFKPEPVRRQQPRNTFIEDAPQVSVRRAPPQMPVNKKNVTSPMSDNFPTPRATPATATSMMTLCFPLEDRPTSPASSDTQSHSDDGSLWSKRSSNTSFDSMYDLSETEDVQIKLSTSVKRRVAHVRRQPSISIPSPSQWPQPKKHQATPISPSVAVQLSPAILRRFQSQTLQLPATSSAPSLDGSFTSDELAASSCPSTPDLHAQDNGEWDAPLQLDPSAFSILQHISGEHPAEQETVIEVPDEVAGEMCEVVESPGRFGGLQIHTSSLAAPTCNEDELSALSIPSPSHFFSSLDSAVARRAWTGNDAPNTSTATEFYGVPFKAAEPASGLATSTATEFYGVPWKTRPENPVEHTITIAASTQEDDEPLTARRTIRSPMDPVVEVDEIDENYHVTLEQTANANIDRTQMWLSTQKEYLDTALGEDDSVLDSFSEIDGASPSTPSHIISPTDALSPSSKKAVRFLQAAAEEEAIKTEKIVKRISPIHDGTFWEAFCHTKRSARARDVFQHRQMRAEAEQVRRNSASKGHAGQLKGAFEIAAKADRPLSGFVNDGPADEEKKEAIARAERERQALDQIQPSSWHVQAQKELNGGTLLTSPIVATFKNRTDINILDVAGQAHCSWAWDVAVTHPGATVYTTVATDVEAHIAESSLDGPDNHCVVAAPKPWEMPFEDNFFDVVSARNLYMHLRTYVPSNSDCGDEWDLTLRECMRILKPGGYLEFDLLDAEIMHPEPAAQALGVEFAFNLKTRGYDPCSGKNFLPRLKRAGFRNIKRAWMLLPLANAAPQWTDSGKSAMRIQTPASSAGFGPETPQYDPPLTGSTTDVRAITGLVGARSWEQWMLKINSELGRDEARCLDGVANALGESGRSDAGWRCLVGWAQKA